jgi:ATP-dependent Clp protease ATP-binding subunit ClpC
VSDAAKDLLVERGYKPEFGARPLRRTIQREVDNRLSMMLLRGELDEGATAAVGASDGGIEITAVPAARGA